jgi:outer membrane protein OmpA-like peptidoglycan-associated protein
LLKLAAALLALCLAAGCASQPVAPALFAVLPAPDGHVGAIVVQRDGESRVVDTAYGAQRLRADGSLEATQLSPEEVKAQFGSTLAALPGAPATFTLYFREGSDELTARSKQELDHVFAEIKRRPLPDIVVIGHTDTVGARRYNDELSLARAERMREMLIELGIPPGRIQARGRGERELLVPTEDEVREPRNRRVEINVR